jgi:hypothetical protein
VSTDKDHLSLPRLYGSPATTPRRLALPPSEPPVGQDDLPIENDRSAQDQALALELFPRAYSSQVVDAGTRAFRPTTRPTGRPPRLRGRPLLLRALGGTLLRPKDH